MNRKIPIISLEDFETKSKKPLMVKTLVNNIAEGVEGNLESVNVAEIKHYDIIISVPKSEWKGGLENAMNYKKDGCCWVLEEKEFNEDKLTTLLTDIIENKEDYLNKKNNLEKISYENTWNNINEKIISFINEN